jgi:catechol 2,3-dioxygenase-like lactoylglutathione lyase family enzyme
MVARNIAHFDVHADDVTRARKFYERVFGWRFSASGPPLSPIQRHGRKHRLRDALLRRSKIEAILT